MIPAVALAHTLSAPDPMQVGPIRLGTYPDVVIKLLGPIVPFVVCDTPNYSYTDGKSTVTFDGAHDISVSPTASKITPMPAKGVVRAPMGGMPVRPISELHAPLSHWTFMGQPIFSKPSHLPGFVVLKPGAGELVHWYRPGAPRIDYYRLANGTVEITNDGPRRD